MKGAPILQEIEHDCFYKFEWPTNVMCPSHDDKFDEETCDIFNEQLNATMNLRKLFPNGLLTVSKKQNTKKY